MPTIFASKGLPGCGKTFFARAFIAEHPDIVRANRDEIRWMLYGTYWGPPINENTVTLVQYAIIDAALDKGHDVYVDDTNLSSSVRKNLQKAADRHPGTRVLWHDHTHVPVEVCIAQDSKRERQVGEEVIRSMHERYLT